MTSLSLPDGSLSLTFLPDGSPSLRFWLTNCAVFVLLTRPFGSKTLMSYTCWEGHRCSWRDRGAIVWTSAPVAASRRLRLAWPLERSWLLGALGPCESTTTRSIAASIASATGCAGMEIVCRSAIREERTLDIGCVTDRVSGAGAALVPKTGRRQSALIKIAHGVPVSHVTVPQSAARRRTYTIVRARR